MKEFFLLYANCEITYDGRAKSTLKRGNYIIIRKKDGTLIIHGNHQLKPLNFQQPGATLIENNTVYPITLTSSRKGETIIISIYSIFDQIELKDWSDHKIDLRFTENDLRKQVIANIELYFKNVKEVHQEYQTKYGPIDLLVVTDIHNICELKRRMAGISACTQVQRYQKTFEIPTKGFIMSPAISNGALKYAQEHDITFVQVNFRKDK
jgi:RecB family endonuclease NucS